MHKEDPGARLAALRRLRKVQEYVPEAALQAAREGKMSVKLKRHFCIFQIMYIISNIFVKLCLLPKRVITV